MSPRRRELFGDRRWAWQWLPPRSHHRVAPGAGLWQMLACRSPAAADPARRYCAASLGILQTICVGPRWETGFTAEWHVGSTSDRSGGHPLFNPRAYDDMAIVAYCLAHISKETKRKQKWFRLDKCWPMRGGGDLPAAAANPRRAARSNAASRVEWSDHRTVWAG